MKEEIMKEVIVTLDKWGEKLAVTGVRLGEEAIKHVWALNLGYLIIEILTLSISVFCIARYLPRHIKWANEQSPYSDAGISYLIWMIPIGVIVTCVLTFPHTLANLISPIWAAILSLVGR